MAKKIMLDVGSIGNLQFVRFAPTDAQGEVPTWRISAVYTLADDDGNELMTKGIRRQADKKEAAAIEKWIDALRNEARQAEGITATVKQTKETAHMTGRAAKRKKKGK